MGKAHSILESAIASPNHARCQLAAILLRALPLDHTSAVRLLSQGLPGMRESPDASSSRSLQCYTAHQKPYYDIACASHECIRLSSALHVVAGLEDFAALLPVVRVLLEIQDAQGVESDFQQLFDAAFEVLLEWITEINLKQRGEFSSPC